jgi:TolA-binding protein
LDTKVAENTTAIKENSGSISTINSTLTDQQNQIYDNRNQISSTNNNLNNQIGGLQGQINNTNSAVSNLTGVAELQSNKSTNVQIDATSDTKYPTVKSLKAYVDQATLGIALATDLQGIASDLQRLGNEKANIASPTFTGTPVLPTGTLGVTQSAGDNSTKLATTAFVQTATAGIALQANVDAKADKNSPTFTGTPSLPTGTSGITQTAGDNSTKLATTAFVTSAVQNYLPRLTTTERDLISGLVGGLTIWNKTNKQLEVYDGTYWVTMNGKLVSNLNVGDSYGGGIVAYIFIPGDIGYVAGQTHGLIAAIVDQTSDAGVKWFPSTFYDVTRTLFGQGLANTISIIAASGGSSLTSYAAGLASNYKGGDYSDWYLPSKDELNKLYQNRAAIGNFATSGIAAYWSSSQKGTFNFKDFTEYAKGITSAWVQLFFTDGDVGGTQKDLGISNLRRVRAVRVF